MLAFRKSLRYETQRMAYVVLRRSRNTYSYVLVESYRDDDGRTRKRVLCYLGREQDGTDTPGKSLEHWQAEKTRLATEWTKAKGERRKRLKRRIRATDRRVATLMAILERFAAVRREHERQAAEAEHWQAFERLRRQPTEQHAQAAKRAYLLLAKRYHPDHGGSHDAFLRLKHAYDRARTALR
jgi:hypothetical protein